MLFGFNASPFISNYILKHHPEKFSSNKCSQGNFEIQSYNSNSAMLRKKMEADGTLSRFDSGWKKVLGYLYSPK